MSLLYFFFRRPESQNLTLFIFPVVSVLAQIPRHVHSQFNHSNNQSDSVEFYKKRSSWFYSSHRISSHSICAPSPTLSTLDKPMRDFVDAHWLASFLVVVCPVLNRQGRWVINYAPSAGHSERVQSANSDSLSPEGWFQGTERSSLPPELQIRPEKKQEEGQQQQQK